VRAAFFSSPGPKRAENEDGLFLGEILVDRDMLAPEFAEIGSQALVAVADGMGGTSGGRVAAFLVLTKLSELAQSRLTAQSPELIERNVKTAAQALTMVARRNPSLSQLGSAVAGLWLEGDKALAFNCGDCRVYRSQEGFLDLLTRDHSLVYELYVNGQIAEEAMAKHPLKNILTSSVQDNPEEPRVFIREFNFGERDSFLLCSDGVWESASRAELENFFAQGPLEGAQGLAQALLKKAPDNFSFIWIY
jgi:protein phosphatase